MHRIAFGSSPNVEEINRLKLEAFDAMIHGDKEVDEYIMFRVIRTAVRQRNKAFLDKPLTWSCLVLERWHKEAVDGFDNTKLTDYDIQSRVNIARIRRIRLRRQQAGAIQEEACRAMPLLTR